MRPADLAELGDFFAGLSVESRYLRFFAPVTPTHDLLDLLAGRPANVDAIVAVADGEIVGHAMAADGRSGQATDVGVVVADAWQRHGVGAALMRALVARAQARGVTSLAMDVLPGNRRVLAMVLGALAGCHRRARPGSLDIRIPLPPDQPRRRGRGLRANGPGRWPPSGDSIRQHDHSTRRERHGDRVPPRDLAAALRAAGLTEVDDSARRRAEYSSDASNYRVVPSVVVFPRHADEIAAALAVARRAGVPLTGRGAGTSIAGNAVGTGVVLDTSRHLNRVLSVDPEARTAVVEPGAVLDAITAAAAPHGLRFGPTRPRTRAPPSAARSATTPAARGRCATGAPPTTWSARRGDRLGGAAARRGAYGRDGLAAAGPRSAAAAARAGRRATWPRSGPSSAGSPGRCPATRSSTCCRRTASTSPSSCPAPRARSALTLGATVRLVPRRAPRAGRARLPRHGRRRRRGARAAAAPAGRARGHWTRGWSTWSAPAAARPRCPDLPRGGGWLFVETAGDTRPRRPPRPRKLVADGGCLDSAVVTGAQAAALWRIREDGAGLGGRTPAGAPAWPGWEDSAVPPASLGPYLREFAALMAAHGVDGLLYGHFGDGCVHVRIDFPLRDRPRVLPLVHRGRRAARRRRTAARCPASTATAGPAASCCPLMYSPRRSGCMGAVKRLFDPDNLLNPGVIVDPAPLDADLRVAAGRAAAPRPRLRLPARRRRLHHRGAPLHRRRQVPGRHHRHRRRDVPVLPGHPGREGLHPRPRPGAAGAGQRLAGRPAGGARGGRGARPVPVLQGLLGRLPGRRGHGHLQGRGAVPAVPAPAAPGVALLARLAAPLGAARRGRAAARLANASLRAPRPAALAKRLGGIDARRDLPRFAPQSFRRWFAARPARPRAAAAGGPQPVLLWVDTFTNAFAPEVGQAAVRVLEAAGYEVRITGETSAAA